MRVLTACRSCVPASHILQARCLGVARSPGVCLLSGLLSSLMLQVSGSCSSHTSTEHGLPGSAAGAARENGPHETPSAERRRLTSDLSRKTGRDRVSDVAETGAAETKGEAVGTVIQKNIDTKVRSCESPSTPASAILP